MSKTVFSAAILAFSSMAMAQDYITPADLSVEQSNEMYSMITEYNSCMMNSRLQAHPEITSGQAAANQIMESCETHLDKLKLYLTENNVEPSLVEGMAKTMRSRAARKMMTQTMNNMAAQAQAAGNAEKMKQEDNSAE
jgi:hypothetical protein